MSLISFVTRIHFADRILEDALSVELLKLGVRRPLVVSDVADAELRERLDDALPEGAHPEHLDVSAASGIGVAEIRSALVDRACDAVVAFGGSRALDLARLLDGFGATPLIAVPTTTASVGLGPTGPATGPGPTPRIPTLILCDPTLTLGVESAATAAAGIDALSHCIEAFLGTAYNPPADGIAIEGVRRGAAFLERAVTDGRDLDARRELMAAALNAGLSAEKGTGGVEAAARAIEAEVRLSARHGICHVALMPPVLSFNAPAVSDRFDALRHALGLSPGADLAAAIGDLGARIGLPLRLSALGLSGAALRRVAQRAAADPANRTNPRHATADDYLGILEAAL